MAVGVYKYKNLNDTLHKLRSQVIDGLQYAAEEQPNFSSPEQMFNYYKLRTRYKKDPKGKELFQTLPTLMENNYHGVPGTGDCDCFTIAGLTSTLVKFDYPTGIVLVGRNKRIPVHIYQYIDTDDGRKYFDLTNKVYDYERYYPYRQEIPFRLTDSEQKKINNMVLELAEGHETRRRHRPHGKLRRLIPHSKYIHLPNEGIQVRQDLMDGMDHADFVDTLSENGYSLEEICELSGKRAERRAAKKADKAAAPKKVARSEKKASKAARKEGKKTTKAAKKTAKVDKKQSKAQLRKDKGAAKKIRAEKGTGATSVLDKFGNVLGKVVGNKVVPPDSEDVDSSAQTGRPFGRITNAYNKATNVFDTIRGGDSDTGSDAEDVGDVVNDVVSRATQGKPAKSDKINILGMELTKTQAALGGLAVLGIGYVALRRR
jgi:hypothetical protein